MSTQVEVTMTNATLPPKPSFESDQAVWESLKQAIATCSGFQQWQDDQAPEDPPSDNLDHQVRDYLRDTLDTLAY